MNKLKLIDGIIKEPLGGAHSDREMTYKTVRDEIMNSFAELKKLSSKKLVETRMEKYLKMGVFKG
jgi:acetyl-CoA carboxylase carboxyl transferase subunit alpha